MAAPSAEVSTIAVPVRVALAPLLPLVEAQVPKSYHNSRDENGFTIDDRVERDPIRLEMAGTDLHASTIARYSLQVCRGRLGCVSCGIDEPLRQAVIALSSRIAFDETWRLHSTTTAQPVTFPTRCEVTLLNFDISDRFIAPLVNAQMREVAAAIDRNTPNLPSIRPRAEEIWKQLQEPAEVAPRTWLVFEPIDVGLTPLTGQNLIVSTTLSLNARTRIVVGDKPATRTTALPALRTRSAIGGLRVPFDIQISYADATALANEQYGHASYKMSGDDLRVETIAISAAANGKLGVDATIAYRGGRLKQYEGPVHLEGTPRVDSASSSVSIPDLDYALDAEHKTLFLRAVEGVAHDRVRARLRDSATFSLAESAATIRAEITKALSRPIASGAQLHGRADAVEAESVVAEPDAIVVHVLVTGTAEAEIIDATRP